MMSWLWLDWFIGFVPKVRRKSQSACRILTGLSAADHRLRITQQHHHRWTVVAGNSIEIPCGARQIHPYSSSSVTWERNHVALNGLDGETGLRIDERTGALYVTHAQLIQAGNYSCFAGSHQASDPTPIPPELGQESVATETHSLRVLLLPEVEVEARQHFGRPHGNATLKCHAVGVPSPRVKWLKNEEPLQTSSTITSGNGRPPPLFSLRSAVRATKNTWEKNHHGCQRTFFERRCKHRRFEKLTDFFLLEELSCMVFEHTVSSRYVESL